MTLARAIGLVITTYLLACRPTPRTEVTTTPAAVQHGNDAAALVAVASRIVAVEIVGLDDRRVIATCDAALLDAVRTSIAEGVKDGLTATPPAWPIALRLVVDGGTPFVAHLVGHDRLRLCPDEPFVDCVGSPAAREVAVPFELFEDVARNVGMPPRLEYRTGDAPPI